MVFDVGLQFATLVCFTVLARRRLRKTYHGNVLSAWLCSWRMPTTSIVVICLKKIVLFYVYVYYNFVRKFTEYCRFI